MKRIAVLLVVLTYSYLLHADDGLVMLDQSLSWSPKTSLQRGFINSNASYDSVLMKSIAPTAWRLGDLGAMNDIKSFNIPVTQVLSDLYLKFTHQTSFRPWENWGQYESNIKSIVSSALSNGQKVEFWEIANEVEGLLGSGPEAWDRFRELNRRTVQAVRAVAPTAKIIGLNLSTYNLPVITAYLDFMKTEALKIDAISWHELGGDPALLPNHVSTVRKMLSDRNLKAQIHINEFLGGQHHFIPGWNLAYLSFLHLAKVDSSNRACWHRTSGTNTSGCFSGLNGLFLEDNKSLTKIGVLYAALGTLVGDKVKSLDLGPGWAGIVSADSGLKKGTLLVGRYSCGATLKWCTFAERQMSDTPLPAKSRNVYLRSESYINRDITVVVKLLTNSNLEAAFVDPGDKVFKLKADAIGILRIPIDIKDGEVLMVRFN